MARRYQARPRFSLPSVCLRTQSTPVMPNWLRKLSRSYEPQQTCRTGVTAHFSSVILKTTLSRFMRNTEAPIEHDLRIGYRSQLVPGFLTLQPRGRWLAGTMAVSKLKHRAGPVEPADVNLFPDDERGERAGDAVLSITRKAPCCSSSPYASTRAPSMRCRRRTEARDGRVRCPTAPRGCHAGVTARALRSRLPSPQSVCPAPPTPRHRAPRDPWVAQFPDPGGSRLRTVRRASV